MKKWLALLLTLVTVFALVACGGNKTPVDNTGVVPHAYPDATMDGKIDSPEWDGSLPIVTDNRKIVIGLRSQATVLDYKTNKEILWLEEQTGFDIEIMEFTGTSADFNTQLSLMITGEEKLPDIILSCTINGSTADEYGRQGSFLNLAGYMQNQAYYTKQSLDTYWQGEERERIENYITTELVDVTNGQMYQFPMLYANDNDTLMSATVINVEWLEKVGKEIPTTIDELYDVLVAFRDKDPNGNGKKDEIPMFGRQDALTQDIIGYIINAYVQFSAGQRVAVEDGKVYAPSKTPEFREAMKTLNKFVKEGLLSDMSFTAAGGDIVALLNPAEGEAYTVGVTACMTDTNFNYGHESIYKYEPLPPLQAETELGGYGMRCAYTFSGATYITSACKDPTAAFRLIDFMNSGEHFLRNRYGVKGEDWDYLPEGVDGTGKGMFGGDAKIIVYPEEYTYVQNDDIGIGCSLNRENYWQQLIDETTDPWTVEMYGDLSEQLKNHEGRQPEYQFHTFTRTEEEEERFAEYSSDIISLIKSAVAEFAVGTRDPYSDADWNAFVAEQEKLHIDEIWVEYGQNSVNRDLGIN